MTTTDLDPTSPPTNDLFRSALLVIVALLAGSIVVVPASYFLYSWFGVKSALLAGVLILACSVAAVILMRYCQQRGNPLAAMLLSMAVRMFPPLIVCLFVAAVDIKWDPLPFVGSVLVYYFLTLAVEVWLATRTIRPENNMVKS